MKHSRLVRVDESSQVGELRRLAVNGCRDLGFDETGTGQVALVATEMATNLVKHTSGGQVLLRLLECGPTPGIELLALDSGPGIANPAGSLRDGYSTAGSAGSGLGSIKRLSTVFDLYSLPGKGTAVLSRIWKGRCSSVPARSHLEVGAVCLPMTGEEVCGDAWAIHRFSDRIVLMVVDGLGHGLLASEASALAVRMFDKYSGRGPVEIIELIHGSLRATRGAVAAVAEIIRSRRVVRYAGAGNISGLLVVGSGSRNMISHNGTLGAEVRKIQEFTYPLPEGALLVMHSDGLATRWSAADYPGLLGKHPAIIAGILFRDHGRGRDDATVVVVRW